jgi:hypothetical protein
VATKEFVEIEIVILEMMTIMMMMTTITVIIGEITDVIMTEVPGLGMN